MDKIFAVYIPTLNSSKVNVLDIKEVNDAIAEGRKVKEVKILTNTTVLVILEAL